MMQKPHNDSYSALPVSFGASGGPGPQTSPDVSEIQPDGPAIAPAQHNLQNQMASLLPGGSGSQLPSGAADVQQAMQNTLQALAGGQHGELVQRYAERYGVAPEELQQRMQELHSRVQNGEAPQLQLPAQVLQQMSLQWGQGALPPGGPSMAEPGAWTADGKPWTLIPPRS